MLTILLSIKEGSRSVCISITLTNSWGSWHLCGQPVWPQLTQHRHPLLLFINCFQSLKDVSKMLGSPSAGLSSCWVCNAVRIHDVPAQCDKSPSSYWMQVSTSSFLSFFGGLGESFCVVCIGLVLPIHSRLALSQPLCVPGLWVYATTLNSGYFP